MKKITIKLICKDSNRFQVIGRNIEVTENSRQDFSTTFTALNNTEFKMQLDKLKNEYQLFTEKIGKNSNGDVVFQLT